MKKIQKRIKHQLFFEVKSLLGSIIRTTTSYWNIITRIKHPTVHGKEKDVRVTLSYPDEIRISKKDKKVLLFYKSYKKKYLCVVVKIHNNQGFIITVYYTNKIKEGKVQWKR